jgi:alkylation response protein AidB-like acyl-CoA dehydrogenase
LPTVRPVFLGLQCGLSIGVARASLAEAQRRAASAGVVLGEPIAVALEELADATRTLLQGLDEGRYARQPTPLFDLRIALAEIALRAVQLELQATGGRAYHANSGFARRWREAAFLPIVTPSLVQLKGELLRHALSPRATKATAR